MHRVIAPRAVLFMTLPAQLFYISVTKADTLPADSFSLTKRD